MAKDVAALSRARSVAAWVAFLAYAAALICGARWVGHHAFAGWWARIATMTIVAIGLLPWSKWLAPRIAALLSVIGRLALILCYCTLLLPFAILTRCRKDVLQRRRGPGGCAWTLRPPLAATLDAARLES